MIVTLAEESLGFCNLFNIISFRKYINMYISFTLFPAHSTVGRGNLMFLKTLRSPLSAEFWSDSLRVEWQNSTPRLASTLERRNVNINLSKYFISSSEDRTHNQSVLQSHFVPLRYDWSQEKSTEYVIQLWNKNNSTELILLNSYTEAQHCTRKWKCFRSKFIFI